MGFENHLKTAVLLAVMTALFLFVGSLFGRTGFVIAIVFVVAMNFFSYFYSDKIVLRMYRAKEVNEQTSPRLYNMCKDLAYKTNMPMPKVYIIPDHSPNAFATGRNKNHAAVAATEGIMELLNDKELKGVMAHEFAHIKNRDILISSVVGMMAGVISFAASMAQWSAIFGFGGRDNNGANMITLLVLAIVTPIIATIIQLAISRSREYLADATGAKFVGDGSGLASALEKLERGSRARPMRLGNESTAHLFISNPFSGRNFSSLLSTHPSTKERVRRLQRMAF